MRLVDVLEEARSRAKAILLERAAGIAAKEKEKAASAAADGSATAAPATPAAAVAADSPELDATAAVLGYGGARHMVDMDRLRLTLRTYGAHGLQCELFYRMTTNP